MHFDKENLLLQNLFFSKFSKEVINFILRCFDAYALFIYRTALKYMLMLQKHFVQLLDMLHRGCLQKSPAPGPIVYSYFGYWLFPFLFFLYFLIFVGFDCCHSFIERLFRHALEDSRPKSVLVNLLSVCISMLDPKRLTSGAYYMFTRQMTHGSGNAASPETVRGMLDGLG